MRLHFQFVLAFSGPYADFVSSSFLLFTERRNHWTIILPAAEHSGLPKLRCTIYLARNARNGFNVTGMWCQHRLLSSNTFEEHVVYAVTLDYDIENAYPLGKCLTRKGKGSRLRQGGTTARTTPFGQFLVMFCKSVSTRVTILRQLVSASCLLQSVHVLSPHPSLLPRRIAQSAEHRAVGECIVKQQGCSRWCLFDDGVRHGDVYATA